MVVDLMDWPGGRRCCICFEGCTVEELEPVSDEPGRVWDVCRKCAGVEKLAGARY